MRWLAYIKTNLSKLKAQHKIEIKNSKRVSCPHLVIPNFDLTAITPGNDVRLVAPWVVTQAVDATLVRDTEVGLRGTQLPDLGKQTFVGVVCLFVCLLIKLDRNSVISSLFAYQTNAKSGRLI